MQRILLQSSLTESYQVGVIVGLISTSVQSLGLTLQRQSHLLEDEKDYEERKSAWKRPRWQAGMLMFVASNLIGSTIQITTLPLPVLSTLQAAGLVFNTAFATLLLKEPFTRFSAVGTLLTCVGAALIATFGAIAEPAHNLQQLVDLLKARSFIVWMASTLLLAVVTILAAHLLKSYSSHKHITRHWLDRSERPRSASSDGSPSRVKRSFTLHLPRPLQLRLSRLRIIRGLMYALTSGILSAHSLLMAKSAVELIVRTVVDHINQFNRFESWLILLALLFFALTQLYYLHLGLRLCSTSVLYPFVFCIYNVVAILDGLIYFQQGSLLSGLDAGLVALGTVILLAGVLALSWRLDDTTPQEPAPLVTPTTPLGPGLGTFRTSEDNLESSASSRRGSMNSERAPLLSKRKRVRKAELPDTNQRDIWDELDDQENDYDDVLSSLPKSPAPFLWSRKKRSGSDSSQAISSTSEQSADELEGSKRRPTTRSADQRRSSAPQSSMKGSRSASAGQADNMNEDSTARAARRRGHTVHFEDSARPSRFDASGKSDENKPVEAPDQESI